MKAITVRIPVRSRSEDVKVYILSDLHIGNRLCDEALVRETVKEIQNSGAYWIGLGDIVDAIGRLDTRHKEGVLAPWLWGQNMVFDVQRDYAAKLLAPIGKQCLAYLKGNHEEWTERAGVDMYYRLGYMAGIDTAQMPGMSCMLRLQLARSNNGGVRTLVFYLHHGWGGGDLMGGHALKLARLSAHYLADVYAIGHGHKPITFPGTRLGLNMNGELEEKRYYMLEVGSFLRTLDEEETSYSERKGYSPAQRGAALIVMRADDRKRLTVTV